MALENIGHVVVWNTFIDLFIYLSSMKAPGHHSHRK